MNKEFFNMFLNDTRSIATMATSGAEVISNHSANVDTRAKLSKVSTTTGLVCLFTAGIQLAVGIAEVLSAKSEDKKEGE